MTVHQDSAGVSEGFGGREFDLEPYGNKIISELSHILIISISALSQNFRH